MNSRFVLKRLKQLEKQVCSQQEISERAIKIKELLWKHEQLLKEMRSDPEYSVEWEKEIVDDAIQDLVKEGLLIRAELLDEKVTGEDSE